MLWLLVIPAVMVLGWMVVARVGKSDHGDTPFVERGTLAIHVCELCSRETRSRYEGPVPYVIACECQGSAYHQPHLTTMAARE